MRKRREFLSTGRCDFRCESEDERFSLSLWCEREHCGEFVGRRLRSRRPVGAATTTTNM